jgi:hypothetical protein
MCPNRQACDYDWICLCDSRLDGSFVNGWLSERNRLRTLKDDENRVTVIAALEDEANSNYGQWRATL